MEMTSWSLKHETYKCNFCSEFFLYSLLKHMNDYVIYFIFCYPWFIILMFTLIWVQSSFVCVGKPWCTLCVNTSSLSITRGVANWNCNLTLLCFLTFLENLRSASLPFSYLQNCEICQSFFAIVLIISLMRS